MIDLNKLRMVLLAHMLITTISPAMAIIGGQPTSSSSTSTFIVLKKDGKKAGFCSGILIAPRVIVTSPSCVSASMAILIRGANEKSMEFIKVADHKVHPKYNYEQRPINLSYPIALFLLETAINHEPTMISDFIPPVGSRLSLGGYGQTIEGNSQSVGIFNTVSLVLNEPRSNILAWTFGNGQLGTCFGDAGGPVSFNGYVVGVHAWSKGKNGNSCGELSQAIWFGAARKWIDETLRAWRISLHWNNAKILNSGSLPASNLNGKSTKNSAADVTPFFQ